MINGKIKNIIRWTLLKTSIVTMVLAPVSQGLAAQNQMNEISKAKVIESLAQMGLNKSTTYGEFYKKNKDIFPPRLQKELASYFENNKNELMPQIDVGSVKSSDGQVVPTLRFSQKGQLINVQLTGAPEKYLKFNNTVLTEIDLINFSDALEKISAGDQKLRNQLSNSNESNRKSNSKVLDFDEKVWARLTPQQRAGYVIALRTMYNDAHGVLLAQANDKNKKVVPRKHSLLDNLFGREAYAIGQGEDDKANEVSTEWKIADKAKDQGSSSSDEAVPVTAAISTQANNGLDSCLVAGYVTKYKGKVCTYSLLKEEYKNGSSLARKAFEYCGNNQIACNPLVFGTPGGKPRCIDRKNNPKVQVATHYSGPCEDNNHTNSEIKFLKDQKDNAGRYASDNVTMTAEQIKEKALSEQLPNFEATEKYIKGLLLYSENKDALKLFTDKKPDATLMTELLRIKNDFQSEINQATAACKQASQNQRKHEPNFWGACDQLQRRFLFVAEYIDKNMPCPDKSKVDPDTLVCSCSGSETGTVLPGAECKVKPVEPKPPVVVPPKEETGGATSVGSCNPACKDNQTCEKVAEHDGVEHWQCVGANGVPAGPVKKKKTFKNFLDKALPWIAGAAVLTGMYFLWKPKKLGINPAGDKCPNGSVAPCATTCVAPMIPIGNASSCICPSCPPGQTITNQSTCSCGTVNPATRLVCADGFTIVDKLSDCPKPKFKCWNGVLVEDVIQCPQNDKEVFPRVNSKTNQ